MKAFLKTFFYFFVVPLMILFLFFFISYFIPKYHSCIKLEKITLFFTGVDIINAKFSHSFCECNIPHVYYSVSGFAIKPPGLGGIEEKIYSVNILLIKKNKKVFDASNLYFIKVGTDTSFQNKSDFIQYFNTNEKYLNYNIAKHGIEIVYKDRLFREQLSYDSLRLEIKFNNGKNLISSVSFASLQ